MSNHLIITIGRQYGSGGIEIGRRLSEKLSIPCYDKDLFAQAAKESGIAEEFFHTYDEKLIHAMYYFGADEYDALTLPRSQDLFRAQSKVILDIAERESCIFIGRCAGHVLRDHPNCINIFLHGSEEARIKRIIEAYGVPAANVVERMNKIDKQRGRYYNSFSGKKWNDVTGYHLSIDTGRIGMDKTLELILNYIDL